MNKPKPIPVEGWVGHLYERLDQEVRAMSSRRHEKQGTTGELDPEEEWIGTTIASKILGLTVRQTQRLFRDLDGITVGKTKIFRRSIVEDYAEEKRRGNTASSLGRGASGAA
ncbi:hypothetical protein MBOE_47620 [Mycolicibacterium boenickei]|uniref:Helix-turn-helix domain-containing protein n=1 Tax=Mycolicibacterium boenickei TaxID=146017 RepID=A0ABN5ZGS9_9MYCO|nr:hypothetical protein MBOE_47620 [Mycolicibacterium boenickei]